MPREHAPTLVAYRIFGPGDDLYPDVVPMATDRAWMAETRERNAFRCLPLLMANQHGWTIRNNHRVIVTWNGGDLQSDLVIVYEPVAPRQPLALSLFGHGILTWQIPYLFRTSPGFNLLVRGPANYPRDGASPLEGLVETDWSDASFTMNWKLTRANLPVVFEVGDPICMFLPQRRGELELFQPQLRDITSNPELACGFGRWWKSRDDFVASQRNADPEVARHRWQKEYFQGRVVSGRRAPEHQTKLSLRPFEKASGEPKSRKAESDGDRP